MKIRKYLKVAILLSLVVIVLIVLYFELGRPVHFGIVDFNRNLYEKDFIDHSFMFEHWDSTYSITRFVKTAEMNMGGSRIPVRIEAYFRAEPGWPLLTSCSRIEYFISGRENVTTVLEYLTTKFGEPDENILLGTDRSGHDQTYKTTSWTIDHTGLSIPNRTKWNQLSELAITRSSVRPSVLFICYVVSQKWLLSKLPDSLEPEWLKVISRHRPN